jgi:hypothetical protein
MAIYELPKGHLSPTQVSSYLRCPRAYYYAYVENIRVAPPLALVEGGTHHEVLKINNQHKIEKQQDLETSFMLTVFKDLFSENKREIGDWEGEDEKSVLSRGENIIKNYMTLLAPEIKPVKAEQEVCVDINGVPVQMFPDLVEEDSVIDYKVVGRPKTQRDADVDLQLGMYALAEKKEKVSFVFLLKSASSSARTVGRVPSKVDASRLFIVEQVVTSVADAISRGAFPMCDASIVYTCSPERCGFWPMCKGKREKRH